MRCARQSCSPQGRLARELRGKQLIRGQARSCNLSGKRDLPGVAQLQPVNRIHLVDTGRRTAVEVSLHLGTGIDTGI